MASEPRVVVVPDRALDSIRRAGLGPVVNWLILAGGREPHVGWWDW